MAKALESYPAGTVIGGRYEVIKKLGEGAFSSVYKALDRTLSTEVALKVLHAWMTTDRSVVERFKREVVLGRSFYHDGCCKVFDFADYGDIAVVSMELVVGLNLGELLERHGALPMELALNLAAQAAASITPLHRQGILHRDIKAENMMLRNDGQLKVLDLGLSWSSQLSALTALGSILGTPTHLAPECITGSGPSFRSDVYAMGVLFYHLLAGRLPFVGNDISQTLALQVQGRATPLASVRSDVDPKVEALVSRCLAKDPAQRPADAGAVFEAWSQLLGAALTSPPAARQGLEALERRKAAVGAAAAPSPPAEPRPPAGKGLPEPRSKPPPPKPKPGAPANPVADADATEEHFRPASSAPAAMAYQNTVLLGRSELEAASKMGADIPIVKDGTELLDRDMARRVSRSASPVQGGTELVDIGPRSARKSPAEPSSNRTELVSGDLVAAVQREVAAASKQPGRPPAERPARSSSEPRQILTAGLGAETGILTMGILKRDELESRSKRRFVLRLVVIAIALAAGVSAVVVYVFMNR